jgi:hypothetical protein
MSTRLNNEGYAKHPCLNRLTCDDAWRHAAFCISLNETRTSAMAHCAYSHAAMRDIRVSARQVRLVPADAGHHGGWGEP